MLSIVSMSHECLGHGWDSLGQTACVAWASGRSIVLNH